ncbi:MAG TPA: hypothetical protein VGY57_06835, partial [Vicinamibacterales bacterium]|nr:hypothetical protein [Vicinamibacterales bacterium]
MALGWIGVAIMTVSQGATLARIEPFASWNTPICWTGFILFADSIVYRTRGASWMRSSPRGFAMLALLSIPMWLVFEGYNRFIDNWYYTGLPENPPLRYFGYAWSFATIWPAIFEGADLCAVWRERRGYSRSVLIGHRIDTKRIGRVSIIAGAAMLIAPLLVPHPIARYLAAPVWLGFTFLLDPINGRLGGESL